MHCSPHRGLSPGWILPWDLGKGNFLTLPLCLRANVTPQAGTRARGCHQSLWRWWKLQVPSADQGIGPVIFKGLFKHITICGGKRCRCSKTLADLFYVNRIYVFAKASFDRTSWLNLQRSEKSTTMFRQPEWGPDYCAGGAGEEGESWEQCGRSKENMHDIVGLEMSYLSFKQCSHFQVKQLRGRRALNKSFEFISGRNCHLHNHC